MKPYYDEDGITIYHGDCREVLPTLDFVDVVITSPPYNLGTSTGGGLHAGSLSARSLASGYGTHNDAMPMADYEQWQREVLSDCWATLNESGAIFYNHKPRVQNGGLWLPLVLNPGLPLRQILIWDRDMGFNFGPTHYLPKHEWILIFAKPSFRLVDRTVGSLGDVWRFRPGSGSEHPAPFPVGLPARIIETTAPRLILDPFMGSGTTLRAAKDAGIDAVGIEIEERFCEMAAQRLAQGVLAFG